MDLKEQLTQQDKQIWESWLNEKWGQRLKRVRDSFISIYEENEATSGPIEFFIPHGPDHSAAVENKVHELIPGNEHEDLSQHEKFCLLAAAWLHDIGMLRSVAKSVHKRDLSVDEIRRLHHRTSAQYIADNWKRLGIDETDKGAIGTLCRYHRRTEDINDVQQSPLVGDRPLRLRLLASYLRLADCLDTTPSRAPAEPYAVSLAYGIPPEAKVHWIKNRLVLGIMPNADDRTITIQFRIPHPDQIARIGSRELAISKLNSLRSLVVNDLREELSSVVNVIVKGRMSYYVDVVENDPFEDSFTESELNDLRDMVLYDDIMMAPSASKLLEIVLVTIAALLGFSLRKGTDPEPLDATGEPGIPKIKRKVTVFIDDIEKKLMAERRCHLGLQELIQKCRPFSEELTDQDTLRKFVSWVDGCFQEHHEARRRVQANAKILVQKELPELLLQKRGINILLYGYSELVTKAICGLRDALVPAKYPEAPHNSKIEKDASERIHIFICEGQPKTRTGYGDRLDYHDGAQYALHLRERGFMHIGIIPDILAGSLLAHTPIDCVFIGANGVTPEQFIHTAGQLAIVELTRGYRFEGKPSLIMVISKEKVVKDSDKAPAAGCSTGAGQAQKFSVNVHDIEGSWFGSLADRPLSRTHIWMSRDRRLLDALYTKGIFFVNPREERIQIEEVDYIISDVGYRKVTKKNAGSVIRQLFFPMRAKE
jgi:HD domain